MTQVTAPTGAPPSFVRTVLRLGRVSNLPTVWTNVLAGAALAGAALEAWYTGPLALALSALYVAGMFFNDAFDRRWDAQHRPERPIPSGAISAAFVFGAGAFLMVFGVAVVGALSWLDFLPSWGPFWAALALAGLILLYDAWHKDNPLSPILMGLCRVGVYTSAGLMAREPAPLLWWGCALLLCHLIGLSAVAKRESEVTPARARTWAAILLVVPVAGLTLLASGLGTVLRARPEALPFGTLYALAVAVGTAAALGFSPLRPMQAWRPNPRFAVPWLIAAISLLDAAFLALCAPTPWLPWAAVGCFLLTLLLQRFVPGT